MEGLQKAMKWDEEKYGREYDLVYADTRFFLIDRVSIRKCSVVYNTSVV
jgi:hypothetical protein